MIKQHNNPIRDNEFFKYVSTKKYLKIFVPGFAFKHDNDFEGKDKFVGREIQFRRLYMWLTSDSKSGSYLITGYRGMGKSMLVKRVLDMISRDRLAWLELVFYVGILLAMFACVLTIGQVEIHKMEFLPWLLGFISILLLLFLAVYKHYYYFKFQKDFLIWNRQICISKEVLSKFIIKYKDGRNKKFNRLHISINLGQEILNEKDVLSVIAQNVRNAYKRFVKTRQCRPLYHYLPLLGLCILSTYLTYKGLNEIYAILGDISNDNNNGFISHIFNGFKELFNKSSHGWRYGLAFIGIDTCLFFLLYYFTSRIRLLIPYFSTPYQAINRLDNLCERINASVNEENSDSSSVKNTWLSISFFNRSRKKEYPIANVREIEQELQDIINSIASRYECPKAFMAQFIIVFDELDKVSESEKTNMMSHESGTVSAPEFDTSIEGFTGTMGFEERKKEVLHLLANMKLFITTVKAKCVFISGHELFDASLADLSDREFAISSVFNGVLNIDSFLTPEREQNEVTSMTELYLATLLLPEDFLLNRIKDNIEINGVIKEELPSLRWYNDYLLKDMLNSSMAKDDKWVSQREKEIQFVVEFLHHFAVYLAHISNGSPKKISTYFEKYIRTEYDTQSLYEWDDVVSIGHYHPKEKNSTEQCVLWFDINAQRFINFIYYIASPIMKTITNEISHFGDKLLVTSSFILDQIYKYHGKGFSWRNLEQMPELLNANKNPELRDSMSTMMEFLLQTHITRISAGVNQYKFHKQISEEITFMSMTSEEASAIFNFTLNESMTVKRYNLRLLDHYLNLAKKASNSTKYNHVLERIHENLGDIYYMDEDYYCAIHEYSNALNYLDDVSGGLGDIIAYLKCCLKIGMSYEYRRTYENAYMMYCRIINKLIHVRWIDEDKMGLNYTWRWTKDWRLKQPLLLNHGILNTSCCDKQIKDESCSVYVKQFKTGIWEDVENSCKPEYSTGTDNIISALAYNYTPDKSDIVKKLTVFEDIRYIYLAIIAKLFVIEKMELGGVSYSSLEIAEAEFLYLHSATNMNGKFMISADFFYKMSQIMYYKNGYIAPLQNVNSLVSALYLYDFNILGFIDDFCFSQVAEKNNKCIGAVKIKSIINEFFELITFDDCIERKEVGFKKKIGSLAKKMISGPDKEDRLNVLERYLNYIPNSCWAQIDLKQDKVTHCSKRRDLFLKMGYKLPCNACHYSYRSLDIIMEYLFVDENNDVKEKKSKVSKILRLLYLTSRKHIRHIRQSELIILAKTVEQIGDIMLSCSLTRTPEFDEMSKVQHPFLDDFDWERDHHLHDDITDNAIELLEFLIGNIKSETERKAKLDEMGSTYFSVLDKSILYYWAASRFYEIASLYKEATYCMERVMKVLQGYLKVIGSSESKVDAAYSAVERLFNHNSFLLINNVFKQAAKYVGMEFENKIMGEIQEYKWLFHFEQMDDVDMTKLSEFSDLKSIFLMAIDTKIRILEYLKKYNNSLIGKDDCTILYHNYISCIYNRISNPLRHDCTFKEEIHGYYIKARINKLLLIEYLGEDVMKQEKRRCNKYVQNNNVLDLHRHFYQKLSDYLGGNHEKCFKDNMLFKTNSIEPRLKLVEFLIQDSFVCLSSILRVLTPHNHITTFSNVFMAELYDMLWEWSKYYELLYDLYLYRKYDNSFSEETIKEIVRIVSRNNTNNIELLISQIKKCLESICSTNNDKDEVGYKYTRLLMSIRHDIDDTTIHHLISNVAAEMSTKYYKMAKDANNEGATYKNMITVMYVLDDDLHNDTCQSNLADERYLWHSGYIDGNRDIMIRMYEDTNINRLKSFEDNKDITNRRQRISDRLEDSIYINSEY